MLTAPAAHAGVFFSEYNEPSGTSTDYAVELYNGSDSPVDLSSWSVRIYSNGASTPSATCALTGTVQPWNTWVVARALFSPSPDVVCNTSFTFDGNDAVELYNGSATVDVIGQIGANPGAGGWRSADNSVSTQDMTLRRKPTVGQGDANGTDAFDPSTQFTGVSPNSLSNFRQHTEDTDGDGVAEPTDNCRSVVNTDQADLDGDGQGDACDSDDDGDGVPDVYDNCTRNANADQADADGDRAGDVCDPDDDNDNVVDASDNCPRVANSDQADADHDGTGNACDADFDGDGDGRPDVSDACPGVAASTANGCPAPATSDGTGAGTQPADVPMNDGTGSATQLADVTPPALMLAGSRSRRAARALSVRIVPADEARRIRAAARITIGSWSRSLRSVRAFDVAPGQTAPVRFAIPPAVLSRVRAALRHGRRVVVRVTVIAADAAGNKASAAAPIRLRR